MSLVINISIEVQGDDSWKNVNCEIDGITIIDYYSYSINILDDTIRAEIKQDLLNKGYIW